MRFIFEAACDADLPMIINIYKSSIGCEGCVWTEDYPSIEDAVKDLGRGDLFVLKDTTGNVAGTVSIDDDPAVEALDCWDRSLYPAREISRLGVLKDLRGQGLGGRLLKEAMDVLKKRGCKSAHYLVSRSNPAALAAYAHMGCRSVGSSDLYDGDYICFEKEL